ncbi:hypothetical protein FBQ97_04040 [Acidobacteria bacterium ACD]|nr:MAG: hypothetical protein EDX89_02010 [Acidobacteriota bacterium]MDL1948967.1 hypothetical protein [Acidobacteria bacterium ACD]
MLSTGRRAAAASAVALALLLAACFEPPVREAVELVFDARGALTVLATTRLQSEESYPRNPRARERVAEVRDAARCGEDALTRQLELLAPSSLTRALAYRDGALREVRRTASYADARAVERLFEGAPLSVGLTRSGGEMQLEILPGRGGRATASERREAASAISGFSEAAARYLSALADLWDYLDGNPHRERVVVAGILDLRTGEEEEPPERERALGEAVVEAMGQVHEFLQLSEGRGESLDELSRKAYDPFPVPLSVEVAGTVAEATGFLREGTGKLRVPPVSLWGTLSSLSNRWVRPDPLAEFVRRDEDPSLPEPDVDAFLASGRQVVARPTAAEVREAIEAGLVPAPVYRLRWTLPRG